MWKSLAQSTQGLHDLLRNGLEGEGSRREVEERKKEKKKERKKKERKKEKMLKMLKKVFTMEIKKDQRKKPINSQLCHQY